MAAIVGPRWVLLPDPRPRLPNPSSEVMSLQLFQEQKAATLFLPSVGLWSARVYCSPGAGQPVLPMLVN